MITASVMKGLNYFSRLLPQHLLNVTLLFKNRLRNMFLFTDVLLRDILSLITQKLFKGFNMENQELGDTTMTFCPETPVKRNMLKEEIAKVIGMLTEVFGNVNLEISERKSETKDRFVSIENHMMNLVKDHKDFKE